ncbi:hypothetical protein CSHISOI_06976 [Colletotrichum shisoi]|uniref:Uncharacterized protein n=1 Tax=Colletotrichum shisoi TaxID=2078593 RepID=A0A5Q4BP15_9PEZI|nr:hypothetical protein CSHISOI_06976 [Colletotrichum shisoi]
MATAFQNQQHPGLAHAREWTLVKVSYYLAPLSAAPLAFTLHRHKGV